MSERILLLGGTREAVALAQELTAAGHEVTTSLAGRTREPRPVEGKVRIGGFGGIGGLVEYLQETGTMRVVDATHPFATIISANTVEACRAAGVPLERYERPPWPRREGDLWIDVADIEAAAAILPPGGRVLLALGSQHIQPFETRPDVFFLVRVVDPPKDPPRLASHEIVVARPSERWEDEARLLREHDIGHVVSRNSGGRGAYAKIEAARNLGLPVVMIARPQP